MHFGIREELLEPVAEAGELGCLQVRQQLSLELCSSR
jgi:hypothetical protein